MKAPMKLRGVESYGLILWFHVRLSKANDSTKRTSCNRSLASVKVISD